MTGSGATTPLWPAPLCEEVRTRWGRSASLISTYFEERALWPERMLAIGPDVGIQLVVQEIARLGEIARSPQRNREPAGQRAAASALLWGEWATLAARSGSAADFAAAVDEALRSPPDSPRGAVPRLCRVLLDLDAGDRQRARAVLLALRDWPDGERGGRAFGPEPPVAITGARETWAALAAIAHRLDEIAPSLRGEGSLSATFERAAATTGNRIVDPYFDGPWAGPTPVPTFGWSQGLLRGSSHSLSHRSDGQGRPLFGEVGVRELEIAGHPAFEFVLRAAPR